MYCKRKLLIIQSYNIESKRRDEWDSNNNNLTGTGTDRDKLSYHLRHVVF